MSGSSVFLRYLVIQGMTLTCGIVGPIFLIVYFAAQPDATIKWMYWAGLFITTADILIALGITSALTKGDRAPLDVKTALAMEKLRQRLEKPSA
ncbi:hypothetical protein ACWDUN_22170 [Mycobacterium sp. NPDC003323]